MPYCTNCGEEVGEDHRYCTYCGEKLGDDPRDEHRRERRHRRTANSGTTAQNAATSQQQSHQQDATAPQQDSGDDPYAGFEGDPPPKGYEDPPSVRESLTPGYSREEGTFELFSGSLKGIFGIPVVLGGLFLAWFLTSSMVLAPPGVDLVGLLVSGVFGLFVAGMAYVYTEAERRGESTSAGDAASRVAGQFLPLVVVWLLFVPVFLVGLVLFVLPGLYLGGRLLLAFPACLLDRQGPFDSLSTSWKLTRGVSLRPVGVLVGSAVTFVVLAFALSIVQVAIFGALGVDLAATQTFEETTALLEDPTLALINAVFQAIALAVPIGAVQVAAARLYLQRRGDSPEQY